MKCYAIIICMLKVGKLRRREVGQLAQVHIANWWQTLRSGRLAPRTPVHHSHSALPHYCPAGGMPEAHCWGCLLEQLWEGKLPGVRGV